MTNLAAFLALFQDLKYLLFDMDTMQHKHILIVTYVAHLLMIIKTHTCGN